MEALTDLLAVMGERQIAVAGELTKMYEEIYRGGVQQAIDYFTQYPARGEYTLVVSGKTGSKEKWSEKELMDVLAQEVQGGAPLSQIAREVSQQSGWPRRQVYQRLTQLQEKE